MHQLLAYCLSESICTCNLAPTTNALILANYCGVLIALMVPICTVLFDSALLHWLWA